MKTLYESILSSTGSGANTILFGILGKYLKTLKEDTGTFVSISSPKTIDVYLPGGLYQKRLNDGVFKFWFEKSKYKTRRKQLVKSLEKAGYKSEYEATGSMDVMRNFVLDKVESGIYYMPLDNHLNIYWDHVVIKVKDAFVVFTFVKEPKSAHVDTFVYAINTDETVSQTITSEIEKQLR